MTSASTVSPAPPRRRRLWPDLAVMAVIAALLAGATGAAGAVVTRQFFSASAFVESYLNLLATGRAADALQVPGVAIDSRSSDAGAASDAFLRYAALAPLTDVTVVAEESHADVTHVTVSYVASGTPGVSTFDVVRDGWSGLAPSWRFATSPLAVIDLRVLGAMSFRLNGFEVDKRQVSVDGVDADPTAAVPLLVFSPGLYRVTVDTPTAIAAPVDVLADVPNAAVPVDVQANATEQLVDVVQEQVNAFLAACATQPVMQPTGCPFGTSVQNRVVGAPEWSIAKPPVITVRPDGNDWIIPDVEAVAKISVDVQLLYDGRVVQYEDEVPFIVTGAVRILPDGTASITVNAPDADG